MAATSLIPVFLSLALLRSVNKCLTQDISWVSVVGCWQCLAMFGQLLCLSRKTLCHCLTTVFFTVQCLSFDVCQWQPVIDDNVCQCLSFCQCSTFVLQQNCTGLESRETSRAWDQREVRSWKIDFQGCELTKDKFSKWLANKRWIIIEVSLQKINF